MQRDEIIEMARQAGFSIANAIVTGGTTDIQRFAKLVEAKEREACAKIGDNFHDEDANCGDLIRSRGESK